MSCNTQGSEELVSVTRDGSSNECQRNHILGKAELRRSKPDRTTFAAWPRNPVTVVLDGVTGHYNIGAIFRLCDAFLVERLVICGFGVAERHPIRRGAC